MSKAAANRYAKALFEIANESGKLKQFNQDFLQIQEVFAANEELQSVVKSPIISEEKKLSIVNAIFTSVNKEVATLFDLLASNKRMLIVATIAESFVEMYENAQQIKRATVISAVVLDKTMETKVQQKVKELTGAEALLTKEVDPSLIGGFVLRIDDMQFDASISGSLANVKRNLN